LDNGLGSEDLIVVIVAPPCVRPRGIAGGFRRFVGAGGGGLRRGADVSSAVGGGGEVAAITAGRVCGGNGGGR
jgi:hypothetical protein